MGWVLFKLGKYDEALTQLKKASDKPTGADPTIWDHLGDCYQRLNQRDKAIEAWKKSLEYMEKKPFPDTALKDRIQEKLKSQPLREREPVPAESGVP